MFMTFLALRALLFTSLVAILGSLLYYLFPVTAFGLLGVLLIAALGAAVLPLPKRQPQPLPRRRPAGWIAAAVVVVGLGAWWQSILSVTITDAVRSPWGLVPPFALTAIGVALMGCTLLFILAERRLGAVLFAATFFSMLAMASTVYPLGFGFDPFLHRATMEHIAEYGTITPKPLYYIGEYAMELVGHVIFRIPLATLDRYFLPVFAAIFLTASAYFGLFPILKRKALLALLALPLLPLGAFVSTTPQGIAYVFAVSAIMLTFARMRERALPMYIPAIIAVAAAITHPFAGIPAVLYVAACAVLTQLERRPSLRRVALGLSALGAVFAIPVVFALQAARSGLSLSLQFGNLFDLARWKGLALSGFAGNHYSFAYDALYLAIDNMLWIVAALGCCGIVMLLRERDVPTQKSAALLPAVFAGGMFINFLALSIIFDFDFLISYERTDYAVRSLTMAHLFLLPYAAIALAVLDRKLEERPVALRGLFLTLIVFLGIANVYGAYPRHDNYARSAGFNVSQADFSAVYAIDRDAGDAQYIVLANQATSAAAVSAFGFATYYHGDIFYYPIPTGGPMYEYFLRMVDEGPSRETITAAMDLAGVDLAYFAVSDYWWKSDILIENAKRIADDWIAVGDGAVTIFTFRRE